jgi:subtilisin family serine protease
VVCVGACNKDYKKWKGSNWGKDITIVAPGEDITAAWKKPHQYHTISGTSHAAPMVAGIAATFVGYETLSSEAEDSYTVRKRLLDNAVPDVLTGFPNRKGNLTPNLLVNTGYGNPKRALDPYYIKGGHDELKFSTSNRTVASNIGGSSNGTATKASFAKLHINSDKIAN